MGQRRLPRPRPGPAADDCRHRRAVVGRSKRPPVDERALAREQACHRMAASPRVPPPESAAARFPAVAEPASTFRFRAVPRGASCVHPPPRAPARAAHAPDLARPPDPGRRRRRRSRSPQPPPPAARTRPAGTRRPRRGARPGSARRRRGRPPSRIRRRTRAARARHAERPRRRPALLRPAAACRRVPAPRSPHGPPAGRPGTDATPRGSRARSGGRSPSPPSSALPAPD